jgi:hypothetical protein
MVIHPESSGFGAGSDPHSSNFDQSQPRRRNMYYLSNFVRSPGDPKVIRSGPSALTSADRLAWALGWFSIGLGTVELLAPRRITRMLGMWGREPLVRVYGVREILSGIMSLSPDKRIGLLSRVAGDGLDIATLLSAFRMDNPRRGNVALALLMVGGISVLDYVGAQDVAAQHSPSRGRRRLYHDRTGFPKGIQAVKGIARRVSSAISTEAS